MTIIKINSKVPYDSNIYLVLGRSAILIDTGTGLDSDDIISQIWNYLGGKRLSAVLLTHCHIDHSGGASKISEEFGCPVYINAIESEIISESDSRDVSVARAFGIPLKHIKCNTLLSDSPSFDIGDHNLKVIFTPGHTAGCVCFYDTVTRSLFSGDTVFANGFGRTDLPTGSTADIRSSLHQLLNVNIGTLYPGHGPVTEDGMASVRDAIAMLEAHY